MRSSTIFLCGIAALTGLLMHSPAQAQPDGDVVVNPLPGGGEILLYPGGQFMRVVPQLLEPGQKTGPIHLHMPAKKRRPVRVATAPAEPLQEARPQAPRPQATRPQPKPATKVAEAPASSSGYTSSVGNVGNLFGGPGVTLRPNAPPQKQSQAAPPTRVAKANPPPETVLPGLTRRSMILFAKDATEPMDSAMDQIRFLAGDLNAAMTRPSSRIELQAFGGERGDKGSDARRLSLKRALAIRQVLIEDGVEPGRIDVRAMGGAENGPSDRVDIYVKA